MAMVMPSRDEEVWQIACGGKVRLPVRLYTLYRYLVQRFIADLSNRHCHYTCHTNILQSLLCDWMDFTRWSSGLFGQPDWSPFCAVIQSAVIGYNKKYKG